MEEISPSETSLQMAELNRTDVKAIYKVHHLKASIQRETVKKSLEVVFLFFLEKYIIFSNQIKRL